jgi:hypothetical protein
MCQPIAWTLDCFLRQGYELHPFGAKHGKQVLWQITTYKPHLRTLVPECLSQSEAAHEVSSANTTTGVCTKGDSHTPAFSV